LNSKEKRTRFSFAAPGGQSFSRGTGHIHRTGLTVRIGPVADEFPARSRGFRDGV
jgi:hypothetical protein